MVILSKKSPSCWWWRLIKINENPQKDFNVGEKWLRFYFEPIDLTLTLAVNRILGENRRKIDRNRDRQMDKQID